MINPSKTHKTHSDFDQDETHKTHFHNEFMSYTNSINSSNSYGVNGVLSRLYSLFSLLFKRNEFYELYYTLMCEEEGRHTCVNIRGGRQTHKTHKTHKATISPSRSGRVSPLPAVSPAEGIAAARLLIPSPVEERTIAHVPRVTPAQYALTAEVQA